MVVDGKLDVVDGRVVVVPVEELTVVEEVAALEVVTVVDETLLELVDDGLTDVVDEPGPLALIQIPRSDQSPSPEYKLTSQFEASHGFQLVSSG